MSMRWNQAFCDMVIFESKSFANLLQPFALWEKSRHDTDDQIDNFEIVDDLQITYILCDKGKLQLNMKRHFYAWCISIP